MRRVLGAVFVLGALVAACSPNDPPGGEGRLSIATGGSGGVYQVYGGGLADVLSDELPDSPTTAETTSASVDNLLLVAGRDSDIAFTLADTAIDAVEGAESFDGPQPLRALATLYPNITQVVVEADSGIETIEDLRGKTVSVGSPGSGTEVIALRLLEVAGLVPFAFVLSPNGEGLLLQGGFETIAVATVVSAVAVAGLAVALGGWLRGPVGVPARVLAAAGSILLLYLEPLWIAIGLGVLALGLVVHFVLSRGGPDPAGTNDRP